MTLTPIDVACPRCKAQPGELCKTTSGGLLTIRRGNDDTTFHAIRRHTAAKPMTQGEREFRQSFEEPRITTEMVDRPRPELAYVSFEKYARVRLPKKLKYKIRTHSYVWCDEHGSIHEMTTDPFNYGEADCHTINWRRVYIETDDKNEEF
jgi:hypothetical protein